MTRDLRWAFRWLRKNPLFTIAVTTIFGLGIAANTAVFSIVDAVLLRPLPYESSGRLVRIDEASTKRLVSGVPAVDYLEWRDRSDLFEQTVPYLKDSVTLLGGAEPDQVFALRTGGGLFSLLGVRARLGRTLVDSDDEPASPKVAVLSDRLWRRLFQADRGVLGRSVTVGDEALTIVGVMPPDFAFAYSNIEMWTTLRPLSGLLQVVARTKPGIPLSQLQTAMRIVARQLESADPVNRPGLRIEVSKWSESSDVKYEQTLVFILASVGLVLLIACSDVGGLLLSRAVKRQKEIAIRASLGAGFARVLRQLLAESFALALLGSAAGIALAYFVLQFLAKQLTALPIVLPHLERVSLNGRVLAFNLVLCVLLTGLCSLAPVLSASKTDLQSVLRTGAGGPAHSSRLFSILIAGEAALAFVLLVGSGLMIRSLIRLQQDDHGFRPDHVLTMRVPVGTLTQPRSTKYETKPQQMAYYKNLLDRIEKIPGVRSAAVVNNLPLSGVNSTTAVRGPDGRPMLVSTRTISGQYFAAMGIPLLAGRAFSDGDRTGAPGVVIINEYLARQMYPGLDPVGRPLPLAEGDSRAAGPTVVGVVKDSSQLSYDQPARGEKYLPYQQYIFATFMSTIVVRTAGDPLALANALRKAVWAVDSNQPIVRVQTMNDVIADSIWRPRFSAWIFSVLGALALLLTSAGVYSVVAYTSALRVREVGIRVALGATPQDVIGVILRGAMIPLLTGLAISVVAASLLSRLMASLLYGISGSDPITYVGAGALLLATGAMASIRPAWKAATGDPLQALRTE